MVRKGRPLGPAAPRGPQDPWAGSTEKVLGLRMEPWATLPLQKPHPGTHCPSRKGCYLLLPPQEGPGPWEKVGPLFWAWQEAIAHPGRRHGAPPALEERLVSQPLCSTSSGRRRSAASGPESPLCQHLRGGAAFPLLQLGSRKHWAGSQGESDVVLPGGPECAMRDDTGRLPSPGASRLSGAESCKLGAGTEAPGCLSPQVLRHVFPQHR